MAYIILKGDSIVDAADTLQEAQKLAKLNLPKGHKKGGGDRPSLRISIWKLIEGHGSLK